MTDDYRRFATLRRSADALRTGHAVFFAPDPECVGVLRYIVNGRDALGRPAQDGIYFIAVNRSNASQHFVVDFTARSALFVPDHQEALRPALNCTAVCMLTKEEYFIRDALLELRVKGMSVVWLKINGAPAPA